MQLDYLIIGQGLAGSILSYKLIKRGHKVLVFDDWDQPGSSTVAAGIYNPFTGRKLIKTWMADQLFPYLVKFYSDLEVDLGIRVLHNFPMYRPFLSIDEQNEWGTKMYDERYNPYINSIVPSNEGFHEVVNPLGGMMLKQCGYVDINALISGIRAYLKQRNAFRDHRFIVDDLQVQQDHANYQQYKAQKVIFCEGPWWNDNRFFNWLPLRPVKGELLEIELEQPLDFMVNRGVFILPYQGVLCKVGATFDQKDLDWSVTEKARIQLEAGLKGLLRIPFKIISQLAGVRPASSDRRPLIGLHPEYEPLAVFNGLGTKGVSLAPYLTREFCDFLESGKPLIRDVAINRHFSLYYNKI